MTLWQTLIKLDLITDTPEKVSCHARSALDYAKAKPEAARKLAERCREASVTDDDPVRRGVLGSVDTLLSTALELLPLRGGV